MSQFLSMVWVRLGLVSAAFLLEWGSRADAGPVC